MTRRKPGRFWRNCFLAAIAGLSALASDFDLQLPKGFPRPSIPADNPMTAEKVELGRHLFYDPRLSVNATQSCASCHRQELAFTDGRAQGVGATDEKHPRGAMSLVNVAFVPTLTWAHPKMLRLEDQALVPMFGTEPIELGLKQPGERLLMELSADRKYQRLFPAAFPGVAEPLTLDNVTKALASFERSIISMRSPYDRYHYERQDDAISASAKRGEILFFSSEKAGCFQCHGGWNFSGSIRYEGGPETHSDFQNTGLYNLPGLMSYPPPNTGLHQHTGDPKDIGKFRVPSLRNIAVTAPYMHDGSIATLDEVIDHYAAGGRASGNPNKSSTVRAFRLTPEERADLIGFLKSLTDEELLKDPRWSSPWRRRSP
jgi:cytochrome c peroxidase